MDIGTPPERSLGHTAYFRHRFTTDKTHRNLQLHCQRDDGIVVYLDGKAVGRDNMTEGEEAYVLPAMNAIGEEESTVFRLPLKSMSLPAGEHVLAISLHNPQEPSSDLRIGEITLAEVEAGDRSSDHHRCTRKETS